MHLFFGANSTENKYELSFTLEQFYKPSAIFYSSKKSP